MSGADTREFLNYWESEGAHYVRRGDYDWMASLVPGQRVLEIGCGLGFGTQALLRRKLKVLAIDSLPECLAATRARCPEEDLQLVAADLLNLESGQIQAMQAFAPDTVVCWLMGAPGNITGAHAGDGGKAVVAYREQAHRKLAELACALPSVQHLHLVDRTMMAWQAKDIGRDTLIRYHGEKTFAGLPLLAERSRALYRKLEDNAVGGIQGRKLPPALRGSLQGVVPVLASLIAQRRT